MPWTNILFMRLLHVLICFMTLQPLLAQPILTDDAMCEKCTDQLHLDVEALFFVKNNEYLSAFADGQTSLGFWMEPTLEYYINDFTRIVGGVHMLKYSGDDDFSRVLPSFSLDMRLTESLQLTMGRLRGSLQHKLYEPLYRIDRYFPEYVEYGVQFLWSSHWLESDLWVDWQNFIERGDSEPERFQAGHTSKINFFEGRRLGIKLPIQWMATHSGGQINQPPRSKSTIINGAIGLECIFPLDEVKALSFSPLYFLYDGLSIPDTGPDARRFDNGFAMYFITEFNSPHIYAQLGYWRGQEFIAPGGEFLFQSVAEAGPEIFQADRNILTGKLSYRKSVRESIQTELRFDGYYDVDDPSLSYAFGLYILVNLRTWLF